MLCTILPKEEGKGRSFAAELVASVSADGLVETSKGDGLRPVWSMFAGSQAALMPFMANCRLGRTAQWENKDPRKRIDYLKSVGWLVSWQKEAEGSLATIYHPELFKADPGMVDPDGIKFVVLCPAYWEANQKVDYARARAMLEPTPIVENIRANYYDSKNIVLDDIVALLPLACLTAVYLDRRTRCPLISDERFYLLLLCMALSKGFASFPREGLNAYRSRRSEAWGVNPSHFFEAYGLEALGTRALSWSCSQVDFEAFLSEVVEQYFKLTA